MGNAYRLGLGLEMKIVRHMCEVRVEGLGLGKVTHEGLGLEKGLGLGLGNVYGLGLGLEIKIVRPMYEVRVEGLGLGKVTIRQFE